jgi:hypothetical protein
VNRITGQGVALQRSAAGVWFRKGAKIAGETVDIREPEAPDRAMAFRFNASAHTQRRLAAAFTSCTCSGVNPCPR